MSAEPKRVGLTEAERESLDVRGMFPTEYGWRHPEKWERVTGASLVGKVGRIVASREAAARREALLEAEDRVSKAEDELRRVKAASLYADGHMQVIVDMDRRYDRLRAHADQTEQDLDKARAQVDEHDAIKAHLAASIRSEKAASAEVARLTKFEREHHELERRWEEDARPAFHALGKAEATIARVEALAEDWARDRIGSQSLALTYQFAAEKLLAALAEPELDEEGGCTEHTCPQHGPANRGEGGND